MAAISLQNRSGQLNNEYAAQAALPPPDSGRSAYLVLLGCSILQLPVWGKTAMIWFAISYGVLQEYYSTQADLDGRHNATGIIGTTLTGIMYLSMPFLFALLNGRHAHLRRTYASCGIALSVASLVAASFATSVWQLVVTEGVLQAIGSTLLYSSTTIYIDEWFLRRKGFAYGVMLSAKSAVGASLPLVFGCLLSNVGAKNTLRIWAASVLAISAPALFLLRPRRTQSRRTPRERRISWAFLRHPTFYVYQLANIVFSAGYGMPQTYLSSYATAVLHHSTPVSSLMLAILNAPSIVASYWFGILSDGTPYFHRHTITVSTVTVLSALGASAPVFLLWGFSTSHGGGIALLSVFSVVYGFFAGGYSATWGGVVKELENESVEREEVLDTGLIFGLLNGGRGIGFVLGGLTGVQLLQVGAVDQSAAFAYGTKYGSVIMFTGISAALGGWSVLWKSGRALLR